MIVSFGLDRMSHGRRTPANARPKFLTKQMAHTIFGGDQNEMRGKNCEIEMIAFTYTFQIAPIVNDFIAIDKCLSIHGLRVMRSMCIAH